jgi:hypothetical protein
MSKSSCGNDRLWTECGIYLHEAVRVMNTTHTARILKPEVPKVPTSKTNLR